MKSFSQRTKEGLCRLAAGQACCIAAEMMGILIFSGRLKENSVRVASESCDVVKRFAVLVRRFCGEKTFVKEVKNSFYAVVSNKEIIEKILKYEASTMEICELFAQNDCCKGAFLRGAFLGGGIIVDPQKNYCMEFITLSRRIHDDFKAMLAGMGLDFKTARRKGSYVLYSKNSDIVCDALAYMGAVSEQLEIINLKIERELRSELNRTSNGEIANMDKVFDAAARQLAAINRIEETVGLSSLPEDLKEVAEVRLKNKALSLADLGKLLNPPLTKSGVNHRLKRIVDIAENKV